jgi:hypothetical protein
MCLFNGMTDILNVLKVDYAHAVITTMLS